MRRYLFFPLVVMLILSNAVIASAWNPNGQFRQADPPSEVTAGPADPLPPAARAALIDFQQARLAGAVQPQQIPFPVFNIFLPFIAGPATPGGAPEPPPAGDPADISVTLRADPSIRVARDTSLAYEIRVRNYGSGAADQVEVTLPYDDTYLDLSTFSNEDDADFVSEADPGSVTVTFGRLAPDERRDATVFFAVNAAAPSDTVVDIRAEYTWEDAAGGGNGRSNRAPVLIGNFNNDARYLFLEVTPEIGPQGTIFSAFTDRFIPNEAVSGWFNTPGGVVPLDRDLTADEFGRVDVSFSSEDFAPASYEVVLYGTRSKLTAVSEFFVDPAP